MTFAKIRNLFEISKIFKKNFYKKSNKFQETNMPRGSNEKHRLQKVDIEQRLQIIAPLYRKGWTEREITAEVRKRLDRPKYNQAHCDIQRLLKEWQEERLTDTEAKITSEVARLKLVIREAWEMWEKSKEDHHEKNQTQVGLPSENPASGQVTMETVKAIMYDAEKRGLGDPKYLDIILKAEQQICKLLGLDKVVLDLNAGIQGRVEVVYRDAGVPCATSEDEVRRREGLN